MGIEFEVIKPQIDESRHQGEALLTYARRLSKEKAEAVADTLDQSPFLILSADTIVVLAADTMALTILAIYWANRAMPLMPDAC